MRIAFHKSGESHDRIYANRDDGTELGWRWPAAGPPHDFLHWVIETELGVDDGFWGLIAAGANFNFAAAHEQIDPTTRTLSDAQVASLVRAEALVTAVTAAITVEGYPREEAYAPVAGELDRERFDAACTAAIAAVDRWRAVPPGDTLVVDYPAG